MIKAAAFARGVLIFRHDGQMCVILVQQKPGEECRKSATRQAKNGDHLKGQYAIFEVGQARRRRRVDKGKIAAR